MGNTDMVRHDITLISLWIPVNHNFLSTPTFFVFIFRFWLALRFPKRRRGKQATQVTATVEAQLLIPNVMCTDKKKKKLGKSKHITYKSRAQTEREREPLIQAVTTQSGQDDYAVVGKRVILLSAH